MIRLITIDLDGTLFDSDSKISGDNKRAIKKCIKNGIKVIISTGKSIKCVDSVIKELGLVDPQIVSGGTVIINPDLKIQAVMKIPRDSALNVINLARNSGIGFGLDTTGGNVCYEKEHKNLKYFLETGEIIEKVEDIGKDHIIDNALLFTFLVDENDGFNEILRKNIGDDIKIRRGGPYFLNTLSRKAGKVASLRKILKKCGIDKNEVMAIGDSNNDLGTIEFAGLGIAMGNATRDVKLAADHISADNDNSGVAKAIYKSIQF